MKLDICMKRKITITTGTRADYGILKPVIQEIKNSKNLDFHLIVTGMHLHDKFGKTIDEIKSDGYKISSIVKTDLSNDSLINNSLNLGNSIIGFSKVFKKIKPDINLVLGDRDEMLSSALAASHMNIPNAHIHGGDKSKGTIDEYNRHAITKISNIHFAATIKSKNRIIKMGENPKYVFLTGSPSIDAVISNKFVKPNNLDLDLIQKSILLVHHSQTTEPLQSEKEILKILSIIKSLKKQVIAISPNSDYGNEKIFKALKRFSKNYNFIKLYKSLPRNQYLYLLKNCDMLIGNSSSGIIEGSYFEIPVINIGIRQMNRDMDKTIINLKNPSAISLKKAILKSENNKKLKKQKIYGKGNSSKIIIRILEKINLNNQLIQKQLSY